MKFLTNVFLQVANMSLMGASVIVVICLVRLCLKKAPRRFSYWLWAAAGFRLACPFSIPAVFSLFSLSSVQMVNSAGPITQVSYLPGAFEQAARALDAATPAGAAVSAGEGFPWEALLQGAALLWLIGIGVLLLWMAAARRKLHGRVKAAVKLYGCVYQCENVRSPFIMGLFRPRVYIPFGLSTEQREYVLSHESCHIRRGDHLIKLLAFLILAVHWFNPLAWLAFSLMSRDMELSCDEKTLSRLGDDAREGYSRALLAFAENRRFSTLDSLAFGETGVKERVKNVMTFRKTKKWASIGIGAACVLLMAACAANPSASLAAIGGADGPTDIFVTNSGSVTVSSSPEDIAYQGKHIAISRQELEDYLEKAGDVPEEQAAETLAWKAILAWKAVNEADIDFSQEEYRQKAEEMRRESEKADNYQDAMKLLLDGKDMTVEQYWERLPNMAEFQREILGQAFLEQLHEKFEAEKEPSANWEAYLAEYKKGAIAEENLRKVSGSEKDSVAQPLPSPDPSETSVTVQPGNSTRDYVITRSGEPEKTWTLHTELDSENNIPRAGGKLYFVEEHTPSASPSVTVGSEYRHVIVKNNAPAGTWEISPDSEGQIIWITPENGEAPAKGSSIEISTAPDTGRISGITIKKAESSTEP